MEWKNIFVKLFVSGLLVERVFILIVCKCKCKYGIVLFGVSICSCSVVIWLVIIFVVCRFLVVYRYCEWE